MEKPVDLLVKELKDKLYDDINKSGLPMCVNFLILKEVYADLEKATIQTSERKINEYYESIKQQTPVDENNVMNLIDNIIGDTNI